jgi:hypothetical protein
MKTHFNFFILLVTAQLTLLQLLEAAPWPGYGRSYPVHRYEQDFSHDFNYDFGVKRTFMGYEEPDFNVGLSLPSPLKDSRYFSYNLIIVINDNEHEANPSVWGPPQTMRVYSRNINTEKGLLYFWNISTGIDRASTKKGYYRPISFSSRHWSKQFDAPMLSSVFFDGGRALHSSLSTDDLYLMGKRRSSHGCVHVEDNRADELFHLIGHSGYGLVNNISKSGSPKLDKSGSNQYVFGYKTLIIIH